MGDTKITQAEMIELFGDAAPIEAFELLGKAPDDWTLADIRNKLREIAAERSKQSNVSDLVPSLLREAKYSGSWMAPQLEQAATTIQSLQARVVELENDEIVQGYSYEDWTDEGPDDDKVRIGDWVYFNQQDHNGNDTDEFVGKIVRHHQNKVPVILVDVDTYRGKFVEDTGDYIDLPSTFMINFTMSRITEAEALAKTED